MEDVFEAVWRVDHFLTINPSYTIAAAIDVVCDLGGITSDRDRRVIRHLVECRRERAGLFIKAGRTAA